MDLVAGEWQVSTRLGEDRPAVAHERELWKGETDSYLIQAKGKGSQVNDDVDVAAFQQAVKPVLDKNRATFGDLVKLLPVS